ncbi:MAG: mechanosensitive ion channel [Deltaproteobacteria bacterium]|nr:mechanosensitive ion channel [Deltaproteobacteria bacterium]
MAIVLERTIAPDDGLLAWRVSSDTVSSIAHWYARIVDGDLQAVTADELNRGLGPRPPDLDLSTPARSLKSLVDATRAGRLDVAARSLWLNDIPELQQPEVGRRLARELMMVLDQTLWIDFTTVSDRPFGKPESSDVSYDEDEIGVVSLASQKVPIRLVRVPEGREPALWVVSRATVTRIPVLYDHYGIGALVTWIPAPLFAHRFLEIQAWQWLGLAITLVLAVAIGLVARRAVLGITGLVASRWPALARTPFAELIGAPMQAIFALVAVGWLATLLRLSKPAAATLDGVFAPLTIVLVTWLVLRSSELVTISIERYLAAASAESSLQRSVSTRLQLLRRLFSVLVLLVATAAVLMRFEVVRHIGTGLLASAGFAGIVIGFAAQQTLGNLFTGLLFGITQPVRIGDIVVFESEWGFVEEITLTHVVICTWDLRRLVVPIPYLLARPIQNWTRSSGEVLGTVVVKTSATVDVDALRAEAVRVVKASKLSDGKEPNVSVADFTDTAVEIRVVVGASNAAQLWALRSEVREAMLRWIQAQRHAGASASPGGVAR